MTWHDVKTLAESPDWRIDYCVPRVANHQLSGKVLVAFGEIGTGLDDSGFGANVAARCGISYIRVVQRKRTQYQHLSREIFASVIEGHSLDDSLLYFYGTSLGAYGAAYYGRPLGARILALAPRIPVHPNVSRVMAVKYPNEGFHHEELYMGSAATPKGGQYFLYDKLNHVDNMYIETNVKSAFPRATYIQVDDAGHYVPKALSISWALKDVLVQFVNDRNISFELNKKKIVDWHEERFYRRVAMNKLGYASEHLGVLVQNRDSQAVDRLTRVYNGAVASSAK